MNSFKFVFALFFFVVCANCNQAFSQATKDNKASNGSSKAPEKSCSERTVDHYNDKNVRGEGFDKARDYAKEMDRAGKAAEACRDKNQAEKAKANEPKKN